MSSVLPQSPSTVVGHGSEFELWKAGYYTVVHFSNQDLTILWDRKTTVHIRAGPQWKVCTRRLFRKFTVKNSENMTRSAVSLSTRAFSAGCVETLTV